MMKSRQKSKKVERRLNKLLQRITTLEERINRLKDKKGRKEAEYGALLEAKTSGEAKSGKGNR
jgi:hypothetical protein